MTHHVEPRFRAYCFYGVTTLALACTGEIGPTLETPPESMRPAAASCAPTAAPMRRMTTPEYVESVRDLLAGFGQTAADESFDLLPTDVKNQLVENAAGDGVREAFVRGYADVAEQVVAGVDLVEMSGCTALADRACTEAFIERFATRAYRRPLDPRQRAALVDLEMALHETVPDDEALRFALGAVLESPSFLYRPEVGGAAVEGWQPLDDYALASRLSYLFTGSLPDDELLARAEAGDLHQAEVLATEVDRLLESPRAQNWITRTFFRLWADTEGTAPSYGGTGLEEAFPEETAQFARHLIFVEHGSFADLLTADFTFLDRQLAEFYGREDAGSFGSEMELVAGEPDRNVGILSQGNTVARSAAYGNRIIHRGKFVLGRLLCAPLPPPDPDLQARITSENHEPVPGTTLREHVGELTSSPECQACHTHINPAGFAFENFDSTGRWQSEDSGHPVDASGVLNVRGEVLAFDDLREFGEAVGHSDAFHDCLLGDFFNFVFGRLAAPEDQCLLEELDDVWSGGDGPVRELFVRLTQSPLFLGQPAEVEGESP